MNYDLKPLTLGNMIGKAFNIYFDNFIPLIIITLLIRIPSFLLQVFFTTQAVSDLRTSLNDLNWTNSLLYLVKYYATILLALILSLIESGLIIKIIAKKYLKQEIIMQTLVKELVPLIFPLIGLSLLNVLILIAGFLLLIFPAIIFSVGFMFASAILVLEEKGIIASLKRSWALTKKIRGRTFGYIMVMAIIIYAITFGFQFLFKSITAILGDVNFYIYSAQSYIIAALTSPLSASFTVLLYFNIRIEKEGFAVEHLTNEFSLANAEAADDPYL